MKSVSEVVFTHSRRQPVLSGRFKEDAPSPATRDSPRFASNESATGGI